MKLLGWAIAIVFLAGVLVAGCVALVNDDDSLGRAPVTLVAHHRACRHRECDDRDGRDKRTCFFGCDNVIVVPGLPGMGGDQPPPEERTSLVPPTPDKVIAGIQTMGDAGIKLGSTIAQLVIDYVVTVFRFIVTAPRSTTA